MRNAWALCARVAMMMRHPKFGQTLLTCQRCVLTHDGFLLTCGGCAVWMQGAWALCARMAMMSKKRPLTCQKRPITCQKRPIKCQNPTNLRILIHKETHHVSKETFHMSKETYQRQRGIVSVQKSDKFTSLFQKRPSTLESLSNIAMPCHEYVCMWVCMHVCMCSCVYAFMYVYMYECIHTCIHACIRVWIYSYMYVCMYVHTCVCSMYVCNLHSFELHRPSSKGTEFQFQVIKAINHKCKHLCVSKTCIWDCKSMCDVRKVSYDIC